MERRSILLHLLLTALAAGPAVTSSGQDRFEDIRSALSVLGKTPQATQIDEWWNTLVSAGRIPFVAGDSVAFLYRGEAKSVTWMGDFNGWGSSKTFDSKGRRVPGTDVWVLKTSLPQDARLDYKIMIDDRDMILDPANTDNQWSGVGGGSLNSQLRMPGWREDSLTTALLPYVPRGVVSKDFLLSSRTLGYQITYNVYTPVEYSRTTTYPVMYVTDGYEYMHERMGNMVTVLDNLIYLGKIEPVVVVFIDHRDPTNRSLNKRMQELGLNERYLRFVSDELIPAVERQFSVSREPSHRAIIGNSIGGVSAAWLCFARPDLFKKVGMQSPAFRYKPEIYTVCENSSSQGQRIFLSTGLIHDAEESVRKMREILDRRSHAYEFKAVNQGHSWGNWRDLVDDMLLYLFPSSE